MASDRFAINPATAGSNSAGLPASAATSVKPKEAAIGASA